MADLIKIIFRVIIHYARFELSDWLKNLGQPIRLFKKYRSVKFTQKFFTGIGRFYKKLESNWILHLLRIRAGLRVGVHAVDEERVVGAGRARLGHDRGSFSARQLTRRVAHVRRGNAAGKHHPESEREWGSEV